MAVLLALAKKDVLLLWRDKAAVFFTFVFPVLLATFFGYLFSGFGPQARSGLQVWVIDEDHSEQSDRFLDRLRALDELKMTFVDSADEAREAVRLRKCTAFIVVRPGFGESFQRPFWGEPARLEVGIDPSKFVEAGLLEGMLWRNAFTQFQENLSNPTAMRASVDLALLAARAVGSESAKNGSLLSFLQSLRDFLASLETPTEGADRADAALGPTVFTDWQPISVERVSVMRVHKPIIKNAFALTFPQGMVWALMSCAAAFGISLVVERRIGTLTRLRSAPLGAWRILGGKALAAGFTMLTVNAALFALAYFVFDVRPNSYGLLVAALLASAIAFMGIMMLLAVLGRTEASAGGIGWAVLLVLAMFGGGMVPLAFMPTWMSSICPFTPVYWCIYAIEGALWRDFTPAEMVQPAVVLIGFGVVAFAVGTAIMAKRVR